MCLVLYFFFLLFWEGFILNFNSLFLGEIRLKNKKKCYLCLSIDINNCDFKNVVFVFVVLMIKRDNEMYFY